MKYEPTTEGLSELLSLRVWSLSAAFERRLAAELDPLGLTVSAFRLVGELLGAPDGLRPGELARRLGVKPPSVTAAVQRLEAKGMVVRGPDPDDPRARRVRLAPEAPLRTGVDVLARLDEALGAALTPQQREAATALLADLEAAVAPRPEER